MRILKNLSILAGIASMLYYLIMISYAGTKTAFSCFWLAVGMLGVSAGLVLRFLLVREIVLPSVCLRIIWGVIAAGLLLFLTVEGFIVSGVLRKAEPGADYVIVLGAQVRGTRITKSLRYRLEKAVEYLNENPDTKVVVSGGQGQGEDVSEAEAMKGYLLEHGIDSGRILTEDKSTSTAENIRFSRALIGEDWKDGNHAVGSVADADAGFGAEAKPSVVVVTNSFHVFRAKKIARKQGFTEIGGLAAKSDPILVTSYYVREAFAVVKDFLVGNY